TICSTFGMRTLNVMPRHGNEFNDGGLWPRQSSVYWNHVRNIADCEFVPKNIDEQSDGPKRGIGRFLTENLLAPARSSGTFPLSGAALIATQTTIAHGVSWHCGLVGTPIAKLTHLLPLRLRVFA
ncbi:MAG: hypothetical protein ABL921_33105, partial [Pirellula sp.]